MALWFNKWLMAALFSLPFLRTGEVNPGPHPLHVGMVEIEHNAQEQSLEITCKLFTDDFENILEKTYQMNIDLVNPTDRAGVQKWVNAYIKKHLVITVNGKTASIECIGFERDHEATFSYFQASGIPAAGTFSIQNDLMYDLFDDQTNFVHVIVNGKRQSTKLKYPNKEAVLKFGN